jgi:hypothetical protein
MKEAPDGRRIHHWAGSRDRQEDVLALTATVAEAVEGLANFDGSPALLDEAGGLSPLNLAAFRELIDKNVCGVRIVNRNGKWQREFYSFEFAPTPRPSPPTQQSGPPQKARSTGPDDKALRQIYTEWCNCCLGWNHKAIKRPRSC